MSKLTLMYITNSAHEAARVIQAGVDRIFVDLEKIGKEERQRGLDTVISGHTVADVATIRTALPKAEILVRLNPIGPYSRDEVNEVIQAGANLVMLPMFTTKEEVETLVNLVAGRVRISLLLETQQALVRLPEYLQLSEYIDEIHIGLNDLHLAMRLDFMFEIVASGLLDSVAERIKEKGIRFGFGGIARVGQGDIPAEEVLIEHVRLGSEIVILSRRFRENLPNDQGVLAAEIAKLREWEEKWRQLPHEELIAHSTALRQRIFEVARSRRQARAHSV